MTDDYLENEMVIKEIDVKGIMTKSNLPVADFSVNPYVGCSHSMKYADGSYMDAYWMMKKL